MISVLAWLVLGLPLLGCVILSLWPGEPDRRKAALAAVPAVSDGPADSRDGLDVESVVEERFDGKVIRFD